MSGITTHILRTAKLIVGAALIACLCGCSGSGSNNSTSAQNQQTSNQINGITVPPDPGTAANATVVGVDANNNGIRDEVDRQLATTYGANPTQYDGTVRVAKSLQTYLAANGDPLQSTNATQNAVVAGGCLLQRFNGDSAAAAKAANYIFAVTVNTQARLRRLSIDLSRDLKLLALNLPTESVPD